MRKVYMDNDTLDEIERMIKPLLSHQLNSNWFMLDNEHAKARAFANENNDAEAHEIADKIQADILGIRMEHDRCIEFLGLAIAQAKMANELHTNIIKAIEGKTS